MGWLRRHYGAGPVHLVSLLASFAFAGYVATRILGSVSWGWILAWLAGAVIVHDLILWPAYTLIDRTLTRAGRRNSEHRPRVPWINHLRAPAVISAVLLAVSFPLVLRLQPATYQAATGLTPSPYLTRWLLVTATLFGASAILYAARLGRAIRQRRGGRAAPTEESPSSNPADDPAVGGRGTDMLS